MLKINHSKKKFNNFNINTIVDDLVFALGDYQKGKEIDKNLLNLGIELCETIIKGGKVKPNKMKIGELSDYERYNTIKDNNELKANGYESRMLTQKAKETKEVLKNIKNKKIEIKSSNVKEIQTFLILISKPFWDKKISSFRQIKNIRRLQLNE